MKNLELVPMCTLYVEVGDAVEIGETTAGRKRIIPIIGGRVEGERLSGTILNVGADWQTIYDNGTAELDTRYAIETDTGEIIDIRNWGYRVCTPDVQAKIAAGEFVDPSAYKMITNPRFETAASNYLWLNTGMFVAQCERHPQNVTVSIYEVAVPPIC